MNRRVFLGSAVFRGLDAGGKVFEFMTMFFVSGIMFGNFGPESGRVIHVVEVGEFMNNNVIAEDFGDLHKTDVKRNGATR